MEQLLEIIFHTNRFLDLFFREYGSLTYAIAFTIIFCETGLVITPFLPGDSLLFALGALSASTSLHPLLLWGLLILAAVLGDTVNYAIGYRLGPRIFASKKSKLFSVAHVEKAHTFYKRYGSYAIFAARFVPIIRTFAPFVAGIGKMNYLRFVLVNIIGGVVWVSLFLWLGFALGSTTFVKNNFSIVVVIIILISISPALISTMKYKKSIAKEDDSK